MSKTPYQIIKSRYITEKATVLQSLKTQGNNPSVRRCESPKYLFVVDRNATKPEIARALEQIYSKEKIRVCSVNTINVRGKKRRVRGRVGKRSSFKKAIVTLEKGDNLDNV